jgi:hypothetical protein
MKDRFKNASALSLAAAMTAAAVFGMADAANAASRHVKAPNDAALVYANKATAIAIRNWHGGDVTVQSGDGLDTMTGDTVSSLMSGNPQLIAAIRADVRANSALTRHLEKENININNIDGAAAALDGSLILYQL